LLFLYHGAQVEAWLVMLLFVITSTEWLEVLGNFTLHLALDLIFGFLHVLTLLF